MQKYVFSKIDVSIFGNRTWRPKSDLRATASRRSSYVIGELYLEEQRHSKWAKISVATLFENIVRISWSCFRIVWISGSYFGEVRIKVGGQHLYF